MKRIHNPKIAIVQPKPENQIAQLVKYVRKAHSEGVALILFPEGYLPSYTTPEALSLGHKTIRFVKELTTEYDIAIATGIKERLKKDLFLSLAVFCEGDLVALHRKVFLADFEKPFFKARELKPDSDDVFPVARIPGVGLIGCLLCYENLFPETYRLLRYRGAEIVLGPSGFGMKGDGFDYRESWLCELRSRSVENKVYVVSATNAISSDLIGVVIDPTGALLLDRDSEGYDQCSIDMAHLRDMREGSKTGKIHENDKLKINISRIPPIIYKMLYSENIHFKERHPIAE